MKDKVLIACAPDNNYAQHFVVMINSLVQNNKNIEFEINILYSTLSFRNKRKIKLFLKSQSICYKFYKIDKSILEGAPLTNYMSISTYFRLLLPELLAPQVSKVLYLDCDLIVRTSIQELWNTDVSNYFACAVNEIMSSVHKSQIGMNKESPYFNGGVMLINLEKWRLLGIKLKSLEYIRQEKSKIVYWDQDVMNKLFENQWFNLGYFWNVTHFFYHEDKFSPDYFGLSKEEYRELRANPGILHFSSGSKPWIANSTHPMKGEYFKYLIGTPWEDFNPTSNSENKLNLLIERIRRLVQKWI